MAYPNTAKQLVPHFYPFRRRYRMYSCKSGISLAGRGFHQRGDPERLDINTRQGVPYHVSIGVMCVLDGKDCAPGNDPLHRHPLLSMEFTCAYRPKVLYRMKHRESSEELGSTFVFCVPMAYPNTTKQLVPHFYPFRRRYRVYSYRSGISPARLGFHRRGAPERLDTNTR